MYTHRGFLGIAVVGLVTALLSGALAAQSGTPDCRAIADRAHSGRASRADILSAPSCTRTGYEALEAVWAQRATLTGENRDAIIAATASLRDARLYQTVTQTATSSARPTPERLAALQVLVRYYNPHYVPDDQYLMRAGLGSPLPRTTHPLTVDGGNGMPAGAGRDVVALMARLATDSDPTVRGAALRIRQAIAFSDPEATPVAPGQISLVAGCASRVTLTSTADIDLRVELRVIGTDFSGVYGIRAGTPSKPTGRLLRLPAGTVVATFGGRELARLTERNAPCSPGVVKK